MSLPWAIWFTAHGFLIIVVRDENQFLMNYSIKKIKRSEDSKVNLGERCTILIMVHSLNDYFRFAERKSL